MPREIQVLSKAHAPIMDTGPPTADCKRGGAARTASPRESGRRRAVRGPTTYSAPPSGGSAPPACGRTRQRLGLLRLLLDGHPRHVAAEQALAEARATGLRVSLATVYNTLRQLAAAGVLRRVAVGRRTLFDTNPAGHYHFLDERRGEIRDIPAGQVGFARLPAAPADTS